MRTMTAKEQTQCMLHWWKQAGIDRADLAVRRADGTMIWHHDRALEELPLAWARAENVREAEVFARPARGYAWPLLFLDDLPLRLVVTTARKYPALIVATSPQGGCHLWLRCDRCLDEQQRYQAQRWLALLTGADQGSVSGEHLGRLAGFKNWKRNAVWINVNLLEVVPSHGPWDPSPALAEPTARRSTHRHTQPQDLSRDPCGRDTSESGREWGWVCGLLEAGHDPHSVYRRLLARARRRRGTDAERYARRTLRQALERVGTTP